MLNTMANFIRNIVYLVHLVLFMSKTIKVSKYTEEMLFRIAARIQDRLGRKVSLDEAIRYLISLEDKQPKLLEEVFGSIPTLSTEELYEERRLDEARATRRYDLRY